MCGSETCVAALVNVVIFVVEQIKFIRAGCQISFGQVIEAAPLLEKHL